MIFVQLREEDKFHKPALKEMCAAARKLGMILEFSCELISQLKMDSVSEIYYARPWQGYSEEGNRYLGTWKGEKGFGQFIMGVLIEINQKLIAYNEISRWASHHYVWFPHH